MVRFRNESSYYEGGEHACPIIIIEGDLEWKHSTNNNSRGLEFVIVGMIRQSNLSLAIANGETGKHRSKSMRRLTSYRWKLRNRFSITGGIQWVVGRTQRIGLAGAPLPPPYNE